MTNFLRAEDRYTLDIPKGRASKMKLYGLEFKMPKMPDEKQIKNHGLPSKKQKYTREFLPAEARTWSKEKLRDYAKSQWHRRLNGEWQFIKGDPYYIPGPACVFFDYWTMMTGTLPDFRMEALELFMVQYLYVEPDPDIFGVFDLKCRRLGDTEKILFMEWERSTRYYQQRAGMQSYDDVAAKKNFLRLVNGNFSMPYFFKPIWKGKDKPQEVLHFAPPGEMMTRKKLKDQPLIGHDGEKYLGSKIDYESTVTGKYDGEYLNFYYLDEVFKIKQFRLDVLKQLSNIRRCCSRHNEEQIVGNIWLSSTVEDTEEGGDIDTTDVATTLWNDSDPNNRKNSPLNRTLSGLVRIFRGYDLAAKVDEWGFHKKKAAKKRRDAKLKELRTAKKYDEILSTERKEPATPEEALSTAGTRAILHPELCRERHRQLLDGIDMYGEEIPNYTPPYVEGELVWKNGVRLSEVEFHPSENGKWQVSQYPRKPNNVTRLGKFWAPMSPALYPTGVDSYDADQVIGKGSDGAVAVKRKLYLPDEEGLQFDEHGEIINREKMVTDQYVCVYSHRHPNPDDFYEDVFKTIWWYGTSAFAELDKPGFVAWMRKQGLGHFLAYETPIMLGAQSRKKPRQGSKATDSIISNYVTLLKVHIYKNIWNEKLPRLVKNWQFFERDKRTKFDLSVASGFAELIGQEVFIQEKEEENDEKVDGFMYLRGV